MLDRWWDPLVQRWPAYAEHFRATGQRAVFVLEPDRHSRDREPRNVGGPVAADRAGLTWQDLLGQGVIPPIPAPPSCDRMRTIVALNEIGAPPAHSTRQPRTRPTPPTSPRDK